MSDVLIVDQVVKRFGGRTALHGVSFAVPRGSIFGLLGPNGSGKTTLFGITAGFLRADAGRVQVLGHDSGDLRPVFGRMGILPQDALFAANLPVVEQLAGYLELCGRERGAARREVERVLARVGLGDWLDSRVTALSHGMQKRLGLAQAFLGDPELVLLDEPTAGLDPANATTVRALIREIAARDATVVVSSHDLGEMQELCDRVCILRQGQVVSCGRVEEVARPSQRFLLALSRALSEAEATTVAALPEVMAFTREGRGWRLEVAATAVNDHGAQAVGRVLAWCIAAGAVPYELAPGNRLEQHFLDVTSG